MSVLHLNRPYLVFLGDAFSRDQFFVLRLHFAHRESSG